MYIAWYKCLIIRINDPTSNPFSVFKHTSFLKLSENKMERIIDCVICKKRLKEGILPLVTLGEKGSSAVNRASVERNDATIVTVPGQQVHKECQRIHWNSNKIVQAKKQGNKRPADSSARSVLRSEEKCFGFTSDCFFCGLVLNFEQQKKRGQKFLKLQPYVWRIVYWPHALTNKMHGLIQLEPEFCMSMTCQLLMLCIIKHEVSIFARGGRFQ